MESIQKLVFVIFSLLFLLTINEVIVSQVKVINGVSYPNDYVTTDSLFKDNTIAHLNKEELLPLTRIKNDFAVNTECGKYGSNQLYPDIAMGKHGDFICVWVDERTGAQEVLAQIYNLLGEKKTALLKVSNEIMIWNVAPHVVFNKVTKEYLITWAKSSDYIALQRFDRNGNKVGSQVEVNSENYVAAINPSSAVDKFGNTMVTWFSQKNSTNSSASTAFVRLFDKDMNPVSDQRSFLDEGGIISSTGRDCRIASDTLGNFVVVWSGFDGDKSKIFLQKINTNQWLFEKNVIVSDSITGIFPTISSTQDGNFLITWSEENTGLVGKIYNVNNGSFSKHFYLSKGIYYSYRHSTTSDEKGNFYVASAGMDYKIHKINKVGKIVDSIQIYSSPIKYPILPKLSEVRDGDFYSVLYGSNYGDYDIQVNGFDSSLVSTGVRLLINDDCSSPERRSVVKFNKDGNSIIVWEGKKDGYRNIYGKTYDKNFNSTSGEILISDSSKYKSVYRPQISSNVNGDFFVSFSEENSSYANAFQKISSTGSRMGSNIELSKHYESPLVISNSDKQGNTLFCWTSEGRNWNNSIYFQQFNSKQKPVAEAKELFSGDNDNYVAIRDIWIDEELNILVLWNGYDVASGKYSSDLNAILFNKLGKEITDTILVNSGNENTRYGQGKCMINESGDYIYVWKQWDTKNNYTKTFISKRYKNKLKTYVDSFSTNSHWSDLKIVKFKNKKSFIVFNYGRSISGYYFDDVKRKSVYVDLQNLNPYYCNPFDLTNNFGCDIYNDKLFLAYELVAEKNRGIDIWANVQDFSEIYSELNTPKESDAAIISLLNPYPNPVVTSFTINYTVSKISCVKFTIYNSIGQIVKKLDLGVKYAGHYLEEIDVSNLSAGVYFISGIDVRVNTKKIVVLK